MDNLPYIFRGSIKEYRIPWVSGILCLAAYRFLQLDFYHLYIYFFFASLIAIYIQWLGWGEIQSDGLVVRYGIFHNHKMLIKWDELKCVKTVYKRHNYTPLGGFGAMYDPKGAKIPYIGFEFKSVVTQQFISLVKKDRIKMLMGQTIDILDSKILIIRDEPPSGLNVFFKQISKFVSVENFDLKGDNPVSDKKWLSFNYLDLFILLMPCIIIFLSD